MRQLDRDSGAPAELALVQAQAALPDMVRQMTRLGCQLDIHAVDEDRWSGPLRTLFQVDALGYYRLVAIAGGQGAGKTNLLRNVYPEAAEWLVPTVERGERMPVAVVERAGLSHPRGVVKRRKPESTETPDEFFTVQQFEKWERILAGEDNRVLLVRLEVPLGFWGMDQAGFVLLPGFERLQDQYWQTLMRIVLVTSAAAVVVTDEGRMANAMQQQIVRDVRTAGIGDADPVQVMVALNRCQGKPEEVVEQLVERAVDVYGVERDFVVPIGLDRDSPAGWPARFQRAARQLLPAAGHARRHQVELLRELVRADVREVITLAKGARDRQVLNVANAGIFAELMEEFDTERDALLAALDTELRNRFDSHLAMARGNLETRLSGSGWDERVEDLLNWFRADPGARGRRLRQLIEDTWDAPAAQDLQRECLEAATEARRLVVMSNTGIVSGEDFRPLLGLDEVGQGDTILRDAIRMLPVMALEARVFAISFADGTGHIVVPAQDTLKHGVEQLREDRRTMIAGAALLLGGADVAVDGSLDLPGAVAGAFNNLLRGGTTNASAGTAGAVSPYLLGAATVALAAGVTVQAANRAIKRRDALAHNLLMTQRLATVQHIRVSTEEILRVSRDVLASRLQHLLRMDRRAARQFALVQAIEDAEHARGRMLETVDAGYLV